MLVSHFNFDLPKELIATFPANPRDSAKLLLVGEKLDDISIRDIPGLLLPGDIVVFNDTRVIPARLFGIRNSPGGKGAGVEITLHKSVSGAIWHAFARPARKFSAGDIFTVADNFYGHILAKNAGEITIEFNVEGNEFFLMLDKYGVPPLPPYIERKGRKPHDSDVAHYQTIYAKNNGAVAAPTAGLHFTDELLDRIEASGCTRAFVTLHVGAGTFLPVKSEDTDDHRMHSEFGIISAETANTINTAKKNGGRVIAVGTTSLRLLESATDHNGIVHQFSGETDIFITPGYKFRLVDVLITNFHLPASTLFMLVCAFSGLERIQSAYQHAINKQYRFYSYGDACMLTRTCA